METLVILWHKGLTQPGGNLTPKLPTYSRTKIKARCEHGKHYKHTLFTSIRNNRTTSHRKITTYRLSPEMNTSTPAATVNNLPLQGHWGKRDSADDELMLNVLRCHETY